jgi:hypothetical protein
MHSKGLNLVHFLWIQQLLVHALRSGGRYLFLLCFLLIVWMWFPIVQIFPLLDPTETVLLLLRFGTFLPRLGIFQFFKGLDL